MVLVFSSVPSALYVLLIILPKDDNLTVWAKHYLPSFSRDAAYLHFNIYVRSHLFFLHLFRYLHMLCYNAVPSLYSSQKKDSFNAAALIFWRYLISCVPCITCLLCLSVWDANVKCFALCHFVHSFPNDAYDFPAWYDPQLLKSCNIFAFAVCFFSKLECLVLYSCISCV